MSDAEDTKKPREMSDKLWLLRSTQRGAASALGFINRYREFLLTGKRKDLTEPILISIDQGKSMPTPSLELLRAAIYQHLQDSIIQDGINKVMQKEEKEEGQSNDPSKPYLATVYDGQGNIATYFDTKGEEKELVQAFDDGEHARDWLDRKLVDGFPTWSGQVDHKSLTVGGKPWQFIVERSDSLARVFRKKKKPITTQPKTSTNKLGFGIKAKQDRSSFSKG